MIMYYYKVFNHPSLLFQIQIVTLPEPETRVPKRDRERDRNSGRTVFGGQPYEQEAIRNAWDRFNKMIFSFKKAY